MNDSQHSGRLVITESENADSLVVDLNPEPGGKAGQALMYSTQPCGITVIADRIGSLLESLLSGYEARRHRFDADECYVVHSET